MQSAAAGGNNSLAQPRHGMDCIELSNKALRTLSGKNMAYSSLPSVLRSAELFRLYQAHFYLRIDDYFLRPEVVEPPSQRPT